MSSLRHAKTAKSKRRGGAVRRSKQPAAAPNAEQRSVNLRELPETSSSLGLRQEHMLQLQGAVGNRQVQRLLQRQGARPAALESRSNGDHAPALQRQTRAPAARLPTAAPSAAALVAQDFPNIKLPPEQMAILQKVLEARLAVKRAQQRMGALNVQVIDGQPQGASDQVRQYELIRQGLSSHLDVLHEHKALHVPSKLILGDDILSKDPRDQASLVAFRASLYKTVAAQHTRLPIAAGLNPRPVFKGMLWGKYGWELTHQGGKVGFTDLMRVQKWNIAYQSALLGEAVEAAKKLYDVRRKMGGQIVSAQGKKLGETYGHLWNTTIKVQEELGPLGGYYDDAEGRLKLSHAYLAARGARCVIRGPDNWLHIFKLDKLTSSDMKGKVGDEYVYLLTKGAQVIAERVTTTDGFELEQGSGKTGKGWRMKQISSTIEQFAVGGFFGDVVQDPSVTNSFGQIVIGCIPIVGQIADARDVGAGIYKMWKTGGKDGKVQTLMALIGFIPLLGDGVKAAKKAFTRGGRDAAKEAFAKTLQDGIPRGSSELAKALAKQPDILASALKLSKQDLQALADMGKAAGDMGGEAAKKYAKEMTKHFHAVGENAAALVIIGGGKWADIAKALSKSPAGEQLGKMMHTWRKNQFTALSRKMELKASHFGPDVAGGRPKMVRTGTDSYLSDVDISFVGPHSTVHRDAAIREMEKTYGAGWRKVFDADIFADPSRLHKFEDPLKKLGGKGAREAEKRIVGQAELNVLAKLLQGGADIRKVTRTARVLGIDMAAVAARQKELAKLSTDYLANLLRQGTPVAKVEKMASELGVTIEAVKAHLKTGKDMYRKLELQLDDLHKQFDLAKGNPVKQAKIAEEMAAVQGKLNAAIQGPYMTPGGAAKHVSRREAALRGKGPHKAISPAIGYTALLDDFYMLQHALQGAGKELTEGQAKALAKYGDRLLVSAGQLGTDMTKTSARALWEDIGRILERARIKKEPPPLDVLQPKLNQAMKAMQSQLNGLAKAAKKNASEYLATVSPGRAASRAERRSVAEILKRYDKLIAQSMIMISRFQFKRSQASKEQSPR